MNFIQIQGIIELGLIYSLVAIGVYLSFRVLEFPDLSVDGTFPLGAAITAALISYGFSPWLALACAITGGLLFGAITAFMASYLRMLNLLAGILTMSALYSINLRVMGGRPNLSLLGEATIFSSLANYLPTNWPATLIGLAIGCLFTISLVVWFLGTELGLSIRAAGGNAHMTRAQGIDDRFMVVIGLALSNGLVALSGGLFAQVFGFADASLGVGTIIIGLAGVIIGEALIPSQRILTTVIAAFLGAVIYRAVIAVALNLTDVGLAASDLNLITAVLIALAMSAPFLRRKKVGG